LAGSFIIELAEALDFVEKGGSDVDTNASLMPSRLPQGVKRVTVQAGPAPDSCEWMVALKDEVMVGQLESLKTRKAATQMAVEVHVLDRRSGPVSVESIQSEWLATIS